MVDAARTQRLSLDGDERYSSQSFVQESLGDRSVQLAPQKPSAEGNE